MAERAWKYIGRANTWGEITLDQKSGILYFPTGSPTYDMYGLTASAWISMEIACWQSTLAAES